MLKINNKQIRAPPAAAVLCVGWGVRKRRETHLGAENGGHCILGKVVLRQQTLILFLRNVQKRFRDNRVSTGPDPLRTPLGAAFLAPPPSHLRESTLVWEAPSREEDGNTGFELQRCRCPGFSGRPLAGSPVKTPSAGLGVARLCRFLVMGSGPRTLGDANASAQRGFRPFAF